MKDNHKPLWLKTMTEITFEIISARSIAVEYEQCKELEINECIGVLNGWMRYPDDDEYMKHITISIDDLERDVETDKKIKDYLPMTDKNI